jgi:polyisoprenoid-binding protein YceI
MVRNPWVLTLLSAVVVSGAAVAAGYAADAYAVDPVHSAVVFRARHMNTSHAWGRFNDLTGTFALDDSDPGRSTLDFEVKTASVDTGNTKRDMHLKSPDFFNAVQFPSIRFKSTSVKKGADGYDVTGDLTLHGVTKPIRVKVAPVGTGKNQMGAPIAGIDASFIVKQSEFGMSKMAGAIGDEVWVNVSIEGTQKK